MAKYKLRIKKSALKELEAVGTKADRRRIVKRIESLATDPRPAGSTKISGLDRYRIHQGRYRILYAIADRELLIYVIKVGDCKDVYKIR